jgi:hypothetical protein
VSAVLLVVVDRGVGLLQPAGLPEETEVGGELRSDVRLALRLESGVENRELCMSDMMIEYGKGCGGGDDNSRTAVYMWQGRSVVLVPSRSCGH